MPIDVIKTAKPLPFADLKPQNKVAMTPCKPEAMQL